MQKRRKLRISLCLPVSVARRAALTEDISDTGFCLELFQPLKPGSAVEGYVLHAERELPFRGKVVWTRAGNPMASHISLVGVRFTTVSPELRALLKLEQSRRRARFLPNPLKAQ